MASHIGSTQAWNAYEGSRRTIGGPADPIADGIKTLCQLSHQLQETHGHFVKIERQRAGYRYQVENQQLRTMNQQLQNQITAGRHALSNANNKIDELSTTVGILRRQIDGVQEAASAGCKVPSAPESPTAEKRRRLDDKEQGTRQDLEGNTKQRSTWLGKCLNNEADSTPSN